MFLRIALPLPVLLLALGAPAGAADPAETFERQVRPLLVERCGTCHNADLKTGGVDLTSPQGLQAADQEMGLLRGGDPERSRLLAVLGWDEKVKMPPSGKLDPGELELLKAWIGQGAVLPGAVESPVHSQSKGTDDERASYWSFQPIENPPAPQVRRQDRVRTDIDRFILAGLESAGLEPPAEADKLTLLRRATYDLHGLPPSPEEIDAFLTDSAPDAYERLIERLLASPRYGEKWGRHWLDVARYAETGGIDENIAYRDAWRYREYVIDSFNRDTPFDQFVVEQVAGDLLPPPPGQDVNYRGRIATGFLALGPKAIVEQDKTKLLYDAIDEQIDTVSKAFLGLTIACARCHDHKFDPISAQDYYSLAGIFRNTQLYEQLPGRSSQIYLAPLVPDDVYQRYKQRQDEIAAKKLEIEALVEPEVTDYVYRERHPRMADYMLAAWKVNHGQGKADDVAREGGLDAVSLERLAKYLAPDGSFRPYLTKWRDATEAEAPAVAAEYAAMIQEPAERWRSILRKWSEEALAAVREGRKPPPEVRFEGFAFTKESERFFGEISFLASTFNERDREDGAFAIAEKERKQYLSAETRERVERLEQELEQLKATAPPMPAMTHGVAEGEQFEQRVFIRGNYSNLGEPAPKVFPAVLDRGESEPVQSGSGRLELGRWLGSERNPLTARVIVNRVWSWHFGEGLVRTPDNFGLRGEKPTHPELLDHLATRFMAQGWSIKQLHREIMTSSAYRFSSEVSPRAWEKDPANRLWSRFERRRLTAEEMRDSWLAVDGSLDLKTGGMLDKVDSVKRSRGPVKMDDSLRRTLYLPVDRNQPATMMALADFVDSTTSAASREETYTAPQALYLMNNDFFDQRAQAFAQRLLQLEGLSDQQRIEQAVVRAWGRRATAAETEQLSAFLASYPRESAPPAEAEAPAEWVSLCRLLLASNNFFYID